MRGPSLRSGFRQRARTPANRLNFGAEAPQHDALLWRAVAGEGARATKIIIGRDATCYVWETLQTTPLPKGVARPALQRRRRDGETGLFIYGTVGGFAAGKAGGQGAAMGIRWA